ncbi:LrgB family protein [Magnetovibrio blakemorei]|uniref:LrgB family protein n=1 Tax=Magnetovibrio blakemorei TaxID=28181 RepID=A0A1E5Q7P6_9PROT|nr:LrgB family protein [Magnetovibrio blakemorei]OEJ67141.1 hypothetical protein BEN30_10210 [Magnetovibrio blakemorei]
MSENFTEIWVYLAASPLLGLTLTLVAYQVGMWIYTRTHLNPLFNPVLIAVVVLVALMMGTGTEYGTYFEGAKFVHFMLGPATVALAVPLYRQFQKVRGSFLMILAAILSGSVTAALSAIGVAWALGASRETLLSLAPKSVTAPIAMGIAEATGGVASLTAVLVILTGIIGAVFGTWTLNALGVKDWRARGLAMGTASHGIGTARALQVNEVAGAFASLAMGLNGLATAVLLPLILQLIF